MARLQFILTVLIAALAAGCGKNDEHFAGSTASGEAPAVAGATTEKKGGAERKAEGAAKRDGGAARGGRGGGGGQKQAVEVTPITKRDLSEVLPVVGSLAPNETATIRPEMNGLIKSIHFEEGQPVKKGDLLVKIEESELQAQLAQTQARFELARLNLARAENLRETQSNTQADVDRARSEFTAAQAELDLLKVRLARTEVRAPFDGVVEARTLSAGDYVNTQSIITSINDLSQLKVEFQVPERYLAKVRRGTPFTVKSTTVATDAPTTGEVYFVNSVIDRNTRSSEVKGYITQPSHGLKAGMFAVVEIVLEVRKGALTVPEGSILVEQRGPQIVTVAELNGEKVAAFVPVELGLRSRGLVEVKALKGELTEQHLVVASGIGSLALFPGAKLEPRPLRSEFVLKN